MYTEVDDQRFYVAVLISSYHFKLPKWTAKWSNHFILSHSSNINVQALLFVSPCLWFDLFSPGHRCLSTWWPSKWSSWVTQWWFVWVVDQLQWGFNMIQSMMTFHTEWSKYMNGNETLAHAQSQDVSYDYTFEYKHWTQKLVVCRYLSFSKGFFFQVPCLFPGCARDSESSLGLTRHKLQRSQEAWKPTYQT